MILNRNALITIILALFGLSGFSPIPKNQNLQLSWRDYDTTASDEEKELIAYILFTLGNKPLTKIYKEKDSLKKAGEKIDHLHPLRFLEVVFTDEELKVAIANIKESRWVWGEFKKGLFNSLKDESKNRNMAPDYIADFACALNINPQLIDLYFVESDWDGLITALIKYVPREGNPTRYDM